MWASAVLSLAFLPFPNADLCPGPVGGSTRTLPLTSLDSLEFIEDQPLGARLSATLSTRAPTLVC